nr:LysR family transcriptional regulator [uncultured Desulfobacter sp.]
MHNNVSWDDYRYFLKVARLGSLKAASESLKVNHSTVLRRINSLEKKLEARLFERFKSGYVLTENGQDMFNHIQHLEDEIFSIERKIKGKDIRYEGKIKISTTDTLGYFWLPPFVKKFKAQYPGILVDIDIRTGFTDLTQRQADILICAYNDHPDYMIGKKLAPIEIKLYASKEYIKTYGRPESIQDLTSQKILILNEELDGVEFNEWLKRLVPASAITMSCNMLTSLYRYTRQGMGIAPLPIYVGNQDPSLVSVMDVPTQFHHDTWMLTHPDLKNTRRIKAFMGFMYDQVKAAKV